MTLHVFLGLLIMVSILTGWLTEGVKKLLQERNKTYRANALAGCCSVILSVVVGIAYTVLTETVINSQMAVYLIALVLLSWLGSMVGYDKIIQTISQYKINKEE